MIEKLRFCNLELFLRKQESWFILSKKSSTTKWLFLFIFCRNGSWTRYPLNRLAAGLLSCVRIHHRQGSWFVHSPGRDIQRPQSNWPCAEALGTLSCWGNASSGWNVCIVSFSVDFWYLKDLPRVICQCSAEVLRICYLTICHSNMVLYVLIKLLQCEWIRQELASTTGFLSGADLMSLRCQNFLMALSCASLLLLFVR